MGHKEGRQGYTFELDGDWTPECFLHMPREVFGEFLLKHLSIDIKGIFMQGSPAALPLLPPANPDAKDEMADE